MDDAWLDRYIDAWIPHPQAGGPDGEALLAALLAFMADDVIYEDVPTGEFRGHSGVREMCRGAYTMSTDMTFDIVSRQISGRMYAFEAVGRGTNDGTIGPIPETGKRFELRGASIGSINESGLLSVHRDYWDLAGFLGQLGIA